MAYDAKEKSILELIEKDQLLPEQSLDPREPLLLRNDGIVYVVRSGIVNLYASKISESDLPLRRYFLKTVCPGEVFTGLGQNTQAVMLAVSAGDASIYKIDEYESVLAGRDRIRDELDGLLRAFRDSIPCSPAEYISSIKDRESKQRERRKKLDQKTSESIFRKAAGLFTKKEVFETADISDENQLYNACANVCVYLKIRITPFSVLASKAGSDPDIEDIARLSGFPVRAVKLEENWWKSDSGPLIISKETEEDTIEYMACIPDGPGRYLAISSKNTAKQRVNAAMVDEISENAYMIYRPFPREKIRPADLIRFGIRSIWRSDLVRMAIFTLAATGIGFLLPGLNRIIYDEYVPEGNLTALWQTSLLVLSFAISGILVELTRSFAVIRAGYKMKYTVQSAVFGRLLDLPAEFFKQYDSGELASRATGLSKAFNTITDTAVSIVFAGAFSFLYLWQMAVYSSYLSFIGLALALASAGSILLLGFFQVRLERRQTELGNELSGLMYQMMLGIKKLRISGGENTAANRWSDGYLDLRRIMIDKGQIINISNSLKIFFLAIFSIILFYSTASMDQKISFGQFAAFLTAFGLFSGALIKLADVMVTVLKLKPLFEKAAPILETMPESSEETEIPEQLNGAIEVSNIIFRYENNGPKVLDDISFHIKPGEYVGIVGPSGSGKSTLLKIMLGFEKPEIGKIFFDNKDLESIDKRELRRKLGVVLQDGQIIAGSILDNITITNSGIALERVREVIRQAGLEQEISELPMGIHTLLMEDASTISGGQRQRILIARAIANRPQILFFDEATSALDNITQAAVSENLARMNITRIVVAHRLSTVASCDRILVLDEGRIVEQGTYDNLMAQRGLFYRLADRQMA